jgi:hypothetical protein
VLTHLEEFFSSDRKVRWRVIVVSSLVVAGWGIAAELSGKSVRDAQVEASVVGVLVFLTQVFAYCMKRAMNHASARVEWISPRFPRRLALAAGALLFLGLVPAPLLEAEILRRRFKALASQTPLPDSEKIAELLSSRSSLNRPSQDLNRAERISGIIPSGDGPGANRDNYVYTIIGGSRSPRGFSMLPFVVNRGVNAIREMPAIGFTGLTYSEADAAIIGLIRPDTGPPETTRAPFFARTFVVSARAGTAIYLDYFQFKNLVFLDSNIQYDGGPTSLRNVMFINCTFSLKQEPATIHFAEAVMAHGSTDFIQPLPDHR